MSVVTNEGDQPADWESKYTLRRHANLVSKFTGKMRDQVWTCLEMSLMGMW